MERNRRSLRRVEKLLEAAWYVAAGEKDASVGVLKFGGSLRAPSKNEQHRGSGVRFGADLLGGRLGLPPGLSAALASGGSSPAPALSRILGSEDLFHVKQRDLADDAPVTF